MNTIKTLLAMVGLTLLSACGGGGDGMALGPQDTVKSNPVPNPPTNSCSAAGVAASTASKASATVCMLTSDGEIVVELYADKAPKSVANFLQYVKNGYYNNTIFHRVAKDFVVQGGGYQPGGTLKAGLMAAIPLESNNGLSNLKDTLAMARTSAPDSATSQFYFNTRDNTSLDYNAGNPGYAVFGKIISGSATVAAINAETRLLGDAEKPATEVLLYWAQQLK